MTTAAIERCEKNQSYYITGEELREWRLAQAGTFRARNGQEVSGWTQQRAADWFGCSLRTWSGWEAGNTIAGHVVRRLIEYGQSQVNQPWAAVDTGPNA